MAEKLLASIVLKKLRTQAKLSRKKLAKLSGVPEGKIYRFEQGLKVTITYEQLQKLFRAIKEYCHE